MSTKSAEEVQQQYFEAVTSGDKEAIKVAEVAMNSLYDNSGVNNSLDKQDELDDNSVKEPEVTPVEQAAPSDTASSGEDSIESPKEEQGGTEAPPVEAATVDPNKWLENLDEGVRANVLKLLEDKQRVEHAYNSEQGRIRAAQDALRRADQARREAESYKKELDTIKAKLSTAQPQPTAAASQSVDNDADLQALKETDEQLYRLFVKERQQHLQEIQALKGELNTVRGSIQPLEEYKQEAHLASELDRLTSVVPNAVEILRHPAWDEWKSTVPDQIRSLADSDKHQDVLYAMQLYGQWASQFSQPTETPASVVAAKPAQQSTTANPAAQSFVNERNRKLAASPVGSHTIKPPTHARPSDVDVLNNQELLVAEQERIFKEEMKRMGLA